MSVVFDTVYIIMRHHIYNYPDTNVIVMVCATEELATLKLKWLEEDKPHNMKLWIEDHILEIDTTTNSKPTDEVRPDIKSSYVTERKCQVCGRCNCTKPNHTPPARPDQMGNV